MGDLTFRGMPVPFYTIPLQIISNLAPSLNITVPELPPEFGGGRFGFYNGVRLLLLFSSYTFNFCARFCKRTSITEKLVIL